MTDWKEKDYVVLEFSTADDLDFLDSKRRFMKSAKENIIEVAAVKIKKGEITEHYSTFVASEDFDPHNYELGDWNFNAEGLTSLHLIGAPSFKDVCERLYNFAEGCDLVVKSISYFRDDFENFKESAKNCGYLFNQPVIELDYLVFANELRGKLDDQMIITDQMTLPEIATLLHRKRKSWVDIFDECDNHPFYKETLEKRGGPLSWALAFAQFFISIIKQEEEWEEENLKKQARKEYKPYRKDCPSGECSFEETDEALDKGTH